MWFLFTLLAMGLAQTCHPEGRYSCDDPVCPAVCSPICDAPVCSSCVNTTEDGQVCTPVSGCEVRCPADQCEADSCPVCETVCHENLCADDECTVLCEATVCAWQCRKPSDCPVPVCELFCEAPACEFSRASRLPGVSLTAFLTLGILLLTQ